MGSNQSKEQKFKAYEGQSLTTENVLDDNDKDKALTIGVQETWKEFSDEKENPCQLSLDSCPCPGSVDSDGKKRVCVVKICLITALVILLLGLLIGAAVLGYYYEEDFHSWYLKIKFKRE